MNEESARQPRQRGRASSERVLIEAAIACFAESGPNDVSVRAIAERAGVNHGLVHHYFGSKAGLINAVLEHMWVYFSGMISASTGMSFLTSEDPLPLQSVRAFARIIVDGAMPEGQQDFPVLDAGTRRIQNLGVSDEQEARLLSGQVLAMIMGWILVEPWVVPAIGRSAEEAPELRMRLQASALRMVMSSVTT